MFGNTALSSFSKRGCWSLFLLMVVLLVTNLSQPQTLWASEIPTPPHFKPSLFKLASALTPLPADTIRAVSLSPKPRPREAAAGYSLYYTFTVSNLGNVEDQYRLTVTPPGRDWPLTLLSADSTVKISSTEVIAAGGQFRFVAKLDVPSNAAIGTIDTARIVARSVAAPSVSDFTVISTISLGPAAALPWIESFPIESRRGAPWRYQGHFPYNAGPAIVDTSAVNEPSPPYALVLDGYLLLGDEIRSQPLNLAGKRDVVLQFALEKCSTNSGCRPENGDDFFVDYYNADGEWINLRVFPGGEPYSPNFSVESIVLPVDAYHSSFRFRFRNLASEGPFDAWYVDEVNLFEVTPTKIPFVETFPAATLNANQWPVSTGTQLDTLGRNEPSPPFSANLKGSSLLQTQPIDLSAESAVSVRYYFQQTGYGDEPEPGDDLLLEFRDAYGNWVLLAQHSGISGGLPNFTRNEVILPRASGAYHRDFRLRFRAIGDVGFDDWFVDDLAIDVFSPPEIDVVPTSIATTLFPGDSISQNFVISNAGPGDLFYRIRFAPPTFGAAANGKTGSQITSQPMASASLPGDKYPDSFYQATLNKYEYDWREGRRTILRYGGPDFFGYTWRDSRDPAGLGPKFKWIDIAAAGVRIPNVKDDDNLGPFKIGFAFPFYDSVFTTFRFCSNGFISFTSNSSRFTNDPLPGVGIADLAAPFWDDLDLTNGAAYYLTDAKKLIVQWTNAVRSEGGGPYTFQLILTPEGNIVFQYLTMAAPTNFSTVGIQNHEGSDGLEIAFNTDFVRDSLAVRIERPASWLSYAPRAGVLTAGGNAVVQMKFKAAGLNPDSTYRTELRVESNDVDESLIAVQVALEVLKRPDKPTHFTFDTTKVRYVINIDEATLNGRPLDAGDEIGVFTPAGLASGAAIWSGTGPARLVAYGDDSLTTTSDGFKRGETMFFRIWDRTGGDRDYPATATYSHGDGRFGTGDSARISLLAAQTRFTHQTALSSGWTWISFNVAPDDPNVAHVMAGVSNLAIMVDGDGNFYIPGHINGIGNLDVLEGYKVFMNAPDLVQITGQEVLPNTPIPLRETWNFVSYLPLAPINVESAVGSILPHLVLAKNDAGGFFIPGVINTLGNMQPGRGYRLYMGAADTLFYPFGETSLVKTANFLASSVPVTTPIPPKHFVPILPTADSYSLVIRAASANGKSLQPGDEIGVFTPSGQLVGAGVWPENGILGIAVWRDDEKTTPLHTGRRGFLPGEKMIFRLWRAGSKALAGGFDGQTDAEEITAATKFVRGDGTFGSDVFSILELQANPQPQQYRLHQNFPNPLLYGSRAANAQTLIRYELPQSGFVKLRVYNLLGQVVRTLHSAPQPAGYHEASWDGRDEQGRLVAGGVYLYRLEVRNEREFVAVRKVVVVP